MLTKKLWEVNFFQIAKGHILNMKDSDDTIRVSLKKKSVDKAKGV
jgi:hypothetical protein